MLPLEHLQTTMARAVLAMAVRFLGAALA